MYIPTPSMRDEFINSLRPAYARLLPTKSIKNPDDISYAAVKLFASGTPFRPRFSSEAQSFMKEEPTHLLERTLSRFVDKVWEYFNKMPTPKTESDFDSFHEELCDLFLSIFSTYSYSYGNAQKFTNMLFKYLACFSDASLFEDKFKYCHMALDGYTYWGASKSSYPLSFYRDVVCSGARLTATPWSKLVKSEYMKYPSAPISSADGIINDIRNYFSSHPKTYNDYVGICARFPILSTVTLLPTATNFVLTPFMAEFFIWAIAKECSKKTSGRIPVYPHTFVDTIKGLI
jgi:hypothetical protein